VFLIGKILKPLRPLREEVRSLRLEIRNWLFVMTHPLFSPFLILARGNEGEGYLNTDN
jgi:hypothetical protein